MLVLVPATISTKIAVYTGLVLVIIAVLVPDSVTRESIAQFLVTGVIVLVHSSIAWFGWRRWRRLVHGPLRPALVYAALAVASVTLTCLVWWWWSASAPNR